MVEVNKPVVVDIKEAASERLARRSSSKQDSHVISSQHRLKSIAKHHHVDAKLHSVEHDNLTARAAYRQLELKQRHQANLEQIIQLAHDLCRDETAGSPDPDWLYRFFDMAQKIYGDGMQKLWARILKTEIIKPGSTSLKSLALLEAMTQREAQSLQRACALACSFGSDSSLKLITGFRQPESGVKRYFKPDQAERLALGKFKLPYTDLILLMDLGLIIRTELESGPLDPTENLPFNGQGKTFMLTPCRKGTRIYYYRFSPTGNELAKLVGQKAHPEYMDALMAMLSHAFNVVVELGSTIDTTA
ncbi:TIGR03899 family protein [Enterovibrio nigricans]|uniref:TIGR03899 family protein n=1 Tax=Enterovibrio nigricans DSM 22720 TaxID=1121868 RepID=A0A1T4U1C3_9GAMM|nr:TIGR03899 family protein [Enterovibrio nigricans]PKF50711.1 TIGR03899 family protein [Enterovibrio nigricans]SKA46494.1 TIGR03899 family protein [Enterovibrio nigricans DSM 22720]